MLTYEISRLVCSVPQFPEEDSKLRATALQVRRGGNCPNTVEVLQQLILSSDLLTNTRPPRPQPQRLKLHLVSTLPDVGSSATRKILASFAAPTPLLVSATGTASATATIVDFSHCLYREGHEEAASSYIIRSAATGSRTIVNYNDLPEMTANEFANIVDEFVARERLDSDHEGKFVGQNCWWHFEVGSDIFVIRMLTERSVRALRLLLPSSPYNKCYRFLDETIVLISSTRMSPQGFRLY